MGDVPITTFFTVKPTDRRKRALESPNSSSSSKQPKRNKSTKETKISYIASSARNAPTSSTQSNSSNSGGKRSGSRTLYVNTPGGKSSVSASPHICKGSLPFNIPNDVVPSTQEKNIQVQEIHQSLKLRFAESVTCSSTPSVPPHFRSTPDHSPGHQDQVKPNTRAGVNDFPCSTRLRNHADEETIPSSQSQYPTDHSFTMLAAAENKKAPNYPNTLPAPNAEVYARFFASHLISDYDDIVLSSQTQLLEHLNQSPRKLQPNMGVQSMNREDLSETIPSSQPQEMELRHPADNPLRDDFWCTFRLGNELPKSSTNGMPSDAKASTFIQADIFADDIVTKRVSSTDKYVSGDYSLTESEMEDESTDDSHDLHSLNRPRPQMQVGRPSPPSLNEPSTASAYENSSRETEPPQVASELSQSDRESYGSLPLVLKEFEAMFDDTEDSYPPDFPMSLRS